MKKMRIKKIEKQYSKRIKWIEKRRKWKQHGKIKLAGNILRNVNG